ncbi:MAG: translocation/assembly module TamB domain-containing protein [Candidatus Zixiibacteriota bacterium]
MPGWLKWLLWLAAGLLLILAGVYVYIFHLGGLEAYVIREVNRALAEPGNLRVTLERISGNLFSGVTIDGILVEYADSTQAFALASVNQLSAEYDFSELWQGTLHFGSVELSGLELTIAKDSDGRRLLPIPATGTGGGEAPAPFAVDGLRVTSSRVNIVRATDTLHITDVAMTAAVQRDGPTYSLAIQQLSYSSSDSALDLDYLSGRATVTGSNVLFQDFSVQKGQTRLKANGALDIKTMVGEAEVAADGLVLADISRLFGGKLRGEIDANGKVSFAGKKLSGHMNIGGDFLFADFGNLVIDFHFADKVLDLDTLYGTILGNCGIDGTGQVDFRKSPEEYRLDADVRNLDLNQIVPRTFRSDLTGRLALRGESFSNATLVLHLDVNLYESSFDEYPLQRARGAIIVTTDSLTFPTSFSVDYFENRFDVLGSIDYSGEMLLEVEADLANLDRYRDKLFIDQPGGRGRAHAILSGRTADPDLAGRFWSDSLWIYGLYADSAYSEFDIRRFLTGRQGGVDVRLKSGAAWQVPLDSTYAHLSIDSTLVHIDTVAMFNPYASVSARGMLDQGQYPWLLTLDTMSLAVLDRLYHNRSQMLVAIDTVGFDFHNATITQGQTSLSVQRRVNYDESMDLNIAASGIVLAPWLKLLQKNYELDGLLSAEADLSGTLVNPRITLTGLVDSIRFRGEGLGRLTGSARYSDSLVLIDSLVMSSLHGRYRAEGQLYADLAFSTDVEKRLLDLPFDLRVTAADVDSAFRLVPLLLPSVEQIEGEFYADFHLDGTPRRPHLDGHAYLKNGRLKYLDLAEILHTDSASLSMKDNKILINDVRTYVKVEGGRSRAFADLSGDLTVNAIDSFTYNIRVIIPQPFPFTYDLDDIGGIVMDTLFVRGVTPPTVSGRLTMVEGRYLVEFADENAGSPLMMALSGENTWDLDILIEIPANYWIKNQDIDAEFAGYLNIIRENGRYRFVGNLEILRGRGYLFDKTFRISADSARVIFEDVEYPNPRLDIWATTRIPLARTSAGERSYEDLKVHVTGTLDKPEFAFFLQGQEDAPLGYEAIVPLIVANYYGEASSAGAFQERFSQLLSSQFSQIGTRRLGVETFEIDPTYEGYLDLAQTRVTVGKYAGSNLYLWGRSSVEFQQLPEAGFEFRVSRNLLFEGLRDDDPDEGESFRLNLKMHWEFK